MAGILGRLGATLCVPLALALGGCGMDAQTLQPYTPGEGVNVTVGQANVRNLMVIADANGKGVVSASLLSYANDTLTSVAGAPQKADDTTGSPLVVTATGIPLSLTANSLAVLTVEPVRIAVSSPDLKPGLLAEVTLTFATAGAVQTLAPVVSSSEPQYADIQIS